VRPSIDLFDFPTYACLPWQAQSLTVPTHERYSAEMWLSQALDPVFDFVSGTRCSRGSLGLPVWVIGSVQCMLFVQVSRSLYSAI
jgi:hypothetical protein